MMVYLITLILGIMLTICLIMVLLSMGIKKNTLTLLLSLELLILMLISILIFLGLESFLILLIICVGACEGALGLGALIGMSRQSGPQLLIYENNVVDHVKRINP